MQDKKYEIAINEIDSLLKMAQYHNTPCTIPRYLLEIFEIILKKGIEHDRLAEENKWISQMAAYYKNKLDDLFNNTYLVEEEEYLDYLRFQGIPLEKLRVVKKSNEEGFMTSKAGIIIYELDNLVCKLKEYINNAEKIDKINEVKMIRIRLENEKGIIASCVQDII